MRGVDNDDREEDRRRRGGGSKEGYEGKLKVRVESEKTYANLRRLKSVESDWDWAIVILSASSITAEGKEE